jgi:diguanylate cyclase
MARTVVNLDFFDDDEAFDAATLTQKTLIDTQERMGMMLDAMPMGLLIHTMQGILFCNQEACRLLEVGKIDAIGQHFLDFIHAKEFSKVRDQFEKSFGDEIAMQSQETKITQANGEDIFIKLISCRLAWQGNPVIQVLLQDVTDLKQTEQKLRRLTVTDELTGAYNRRYAFDTARRYFANNGEPAGALSVVSLDVDHFKKINDTYGHGAGDLALVELARTCNTVLAAASETEPLTFARIGGEEFLAILPGYDRDAALLLADRLRQAVTKIQISGPSFEFGFTISLGVSTRTLRKETLESLLSRADAALYAAKGSGRNCARFG